MEDLGNDFEWGGSRYTCRWGVRIKHGMQLAKITQATNLYREKDIECYAQLFGKEDTEILKTVHVTCTGLVVDFVKRYLEEILRMSNLVGSI